MLFFPFTLSPLFVSPLSASSQHNEEENVIERRDVARTGTQLEKR